MILIIGDRWDSFYFYLIIAISFAAICLIDFLFFIMSMLLN